MPGRLSFRPWVGLAGPGGDTSWLMTCIDAIPFFSVSVLTRDEPWLQGVPLLAGVGALAAAAVLVAILWRWTHGVPPPPAHVHGDAGLQPERTALAWGRTMMVLVTVQCCVPSLAPLSPIPVLALFAVAVAVAIYLTRRRRYSASSHGLTQEMVDAEISADLWATSGVPLMTTAQRQPQVCDPGPAAG